MDPEKIIKPGAKVDLKFEKPFKEEDDGEGPRYYSSKISDMRADGLVELYMPYEQTKLVLLPVGSRFELIVYNQGQNSMYECRAIVRERYKRDNLFLLLIELTSDLVRNQRREFFRFLAQMDIRARVMDSAETKWMKERGKLMIADDGEMSVCTMLDISGGGIRFIANNEFEKGSLVYLRFSFGAEYRLCGEILSCEAVDSNAKKYRHRARFVNINPNEQDRLIKYIFSLERDKIRKKNGDRNS